LKQLPLIDPSRRLRLVLHRVLFPGINLHWRDRFARVPAKFGPEIGPGTKVLDAGCGNGMLAYRAWQCGATVLGISIKQKEVDGCRTMFNHGRRVPEAALRFENVNLYELSANGARFDAIICTEVLEHIRDDRSVCQKFFELLSPGGCLHVTTPNADHPYNRSVPLDNDEKGGHVRPGYTPGTYRALFEPIGFTIEEVSGIGGPMRQAFNRRIKATQERWGAAVGLPLFLVALPFLWLDSQAPRVPFSLYARARKPMRSEMQ
jgi:SAM-dependent methyltransferase